MAFWIGWFCGLATAALGLLWRWLRRTGVEKPVAKRRYAQTWQETRNFLYYDGTVMPVSKHKKEDNNGKKH
ncbi:MAG: hypothetical protein IJ518_00245 [Clostridia bacterium]|nr:hypothetical protein [Clostridia bacterium]